MRKLNFIKNPLGNTEIEWRELGTIVQTVTAPSKLNRKSYCDKGKLPIIDQGIKFIAGYTNEDLTTVEDGKYIIFGDHSEHIKYVDFAFIQGADGLKILQPISDKAKYIYYALQNFYKKELSYKRHWSLAKETLIPIPYPNNLEKSLATQTEIVRILDAFTELNVELNAELVARRKQYTYYREYLLAFEEGKVEWKELGELCEKIYSGKNKVKSELGLYPVFGSTGIIGRTDAKVYSKEQILVARVGANAGRVNIAKGEYDVSDNTLIVQNKENIILKFLYYYLVNINLNRFTKGAGQPLLTAGQLKTMLIPLPPLAEQQRIVAILDKFEALTTSLTEGLPREIELRQQQYEYYRELLLSFPKPEVVEHD